MLAVAAVLAVISSTAVARAGPAQDDWQRTLLGRSAEGRPIRAVRLGPADAPRTALVVGAVHGDEAAGRRVVATLQARGALPGVALWLVDTVNPDGLARGKRQNARGVDLNRNFPARWQRSTPGSRYYGGPRPLRSPSRGRSPPSSGASSPTCRSGTTSPTTRSSSRAAAPLPFSAATPRGDGHAALPRRPVARHRHSLAERDPPRDDGLRGRVRRVGAVVGRGAPSRTRRGDRRSRLVTRPAPSHGERAVA